MNASSEIMPSAQRIVIASSSNETYAMGLAVSLCSLLRHLPEGVSADVLVLDGGIRPASWKRLVASLEQTGKLAGVHGLKPEMARFSGLPKDWGSSSMTYARLALPELTKESRVLYLDSDMAVGASVMPLWNLDLNGKIIAASRDVITKTLGGESLPLDCLGLPPEALYFQAGLMLIDLDRWREFEVSRKVVEYIRAYPNGSKFWDQSALNVVLYGHWLRLPDEWNTPAWWADLGKEGCRADAPLLHYVGPSKPWILGHHTSIAAHRFFEELDYTTWRRWRPSRWRQWLKLLKYRLTELVRRK